MYQQQRMSSKHLLKTAWSVLLKVIFIPTATGLITGNRKISILKAFMYISRITHNRTLYKYKSHYDSSWQHKLAQSGLKNPRTQQNPHFRITAQLQEQAMSGLYWLTKGYRSHWAFDTSYNSAYQVHEEITEYACRC